MTKLIDNEDFKKFLTGGGGEYQPVPIVDFYNPHAKRAEGCIKRWSDICKVLPTDKSQKILDIGCNLGFFGIMAVEAGHTVGGFDANEELIFWANKVIEEYEIPNIKLWVSSTDLLQTLREIPDDSYDYVFYLSLHHHMCTALGIEEANKIFQEISRIAPNMIFDMGQSNEADNGWRPWLSTVPQFEKHNVEIPQWILDNSRFKYAAWIGGAVSYGVHRDLFFFIRNVPANVDYSKKMIAVRNSKEGYNNIKGSVVKQYLWKGRGGLGKIYRSTTSFPIMDLNADMSSRYYITTDLGGQRFFIKEYLYCWLSPNKVYDHARVTYERGKVLQQIPKIANRVISPTALEGNMVIYPYCDWPALHTLLPDEVKHDFFDELLEIAGIIYREIGVFDLNPNNILYNNKTGDFKLIDFEPAPSEVFTFRVFNQRLSWIFKLFENAFGKDK